MVKSELDLNLDVDTTPLMTLLHSEYDTYCPGGRSTSRCCDLLGISACLQMSVTLEKNAAGNVVAAFSEVVWGFFFNVNETGIVLLSLIKTLG